MRKLFIILVVLIGVSMGLQAQNDPINVIVIGAHPDDADGDAGGTAILFAKMGHNVKFVSVTNGDAGHHEKGGGMLAKIRRAEAQEAGRRYGNITYNVLDNHDGELMPTLEVRLDIIREIREWKADVVISPRPHDYHPDHRYTGILVHDAAYLVIVPNIAPDTPPLKKNPVFLYPKDRFQKPAPFQPDITIDITEVHKQKIYAMAAHESQYFEWLPWTAGRLDQVPKGEKERLEWLGNWRQDTPNEKMRENLVKWYGESKAKKVTQAEAFEICEYGKYPDDEEIKRLFPMLGK